MATIKTRKGEQILVDKKFFLEVSKFVWYINKAGYAANDSLPRKTMHRLVMAFPKENVDHVNGNKLDNRLTNLRLCNQSQNSANSRRKSTNKSGFKGVSWNKKYSKWEAYLTKNYKHIFLGYFNTKVEAAKAYNLTAKKEFGKFAKINLL